jgi:hypothetical protein
MAVSDIVEQPQLTALLLVVDAILDLSAPLEENQHCMRKVSRPPKRAVLKDPGFSPVSHTRLHCISESMFQDAIAERLSLRGEGRASRGRGQP